MYSLKFAHLVKEKLPGAECHEYFIDMRAYGKGYEEFLERVKEEGVHVVRGRTTEVVERDGRLVVRGEDVLAGKLVEHPVDMVLLAVGLQPNEGTDALARMLGIARVPDGWFARTTTTPTRARPSAAGSSWRACARGRRTSRTRSRRPRPSRGACSAPS